MLGRIHLLCTSFSNSLAEIGVIEMPLMSSGLDALAVLGIGSGQRAYNRLGIFLLLRRDSRQKGRGGPKYPRKCGRRKRDIHWPRRRSPALAHSVSDLNELELRRLTIGLLPGFERWRLDRVATTCGVSTTVGKLS